MLISLFVLECLIMVLSILTTCMVENKFNVIGKSLQIYRNNRAYQTETKIAFIEKLMQRYKECLESKEEMPNIESMVLNSLNKERIGSFSYLSVKSIALKVKQVMWVILILEGVVGIVNSILTDAQTIVIVSGSALLIIGVEIFCIIRSIDEKEEALLSELEDYILNIYPVKDKQIEESNEVRALKNKIIALEKEQKDKNAEMEKNTSKTNEISLNSEDIAEMIGKF